MKRIIWITTMVLAGAFALPAQQAQGGAPRAFGDKDKDGVCDVTGRPVGQRRAAMAAQGDQQGQRGFGCRRGRRGHGRRCGAGVAQQTSSAPAQPEAPAEPGK